MQNLLHLFALCDDLDAVVCGSNPHEDVAVAILAFSGFVFLLFPASRSLFSSARLISGEIFSH
jgi:hypothetical protein